MNKKTKDSSKKKLFGRNLFTFCFIIGILLVLTLGGIIFDSYYGTYKENDVTPFSTKADDILSKIDITDAKHIRPEEFDQFDLYFSIDSIENKEKIKFKLGFQQKEDDSVEYADYSKVTAAVCMAADWVGYVNYSRNYSHSITKSTATSINYSTSLTISNVTSFPKKANTWPVKVKVNPSDINFYLFIEYTYENENNPNKDHLCRYIIEYTYDEVIVGSKGVL